MIDKLYVIFAIEIDSYYVGIEFNHFREGGKRVFAKSVSLARKFNSYIEAEKDAIKIMQERERHGYLERTLSIREVFVYNKPQKHEMKEVFIIKGLDRTTNTWRYYTTDYNFESRFIYNAKQFDSYQEAHNTVKEMNEAYISMYSIEKLFIP